MYSGGEGFCLAPSDDMWSSRYATNALACTAQRPLSVAACTMQPFLVSYLLHSSTSWSQKLIEAL